MLFQCKGKIFVRNICNEIQCSTHSVINIQTQIALPMFANIMKIHKNVVLALAADAKLEQGWQNIRTMLA